ncbi:uncharacterized protein Z520_10237, partial [Fonsecaea multimorphosa CBS 102226]
SATTTTSDPIVDPPTTSSSATTTTSDLPAPPATTSTSTGTTTSDPPADSVTTSSSVTSTTSGLPVDAATTSTSTGTTSSFAPVAPGTTSSTTSSAADPPAGTSSSTTSSSVDPPAGTSSSTSSASTTSSSSDPAGTTTSSSAPSTSSSSSDPPTTSSSSGSTTSSSADPTSTSTSSSADPTSTSTSSSADPTSTSTFSRPSFTTSSADPVSTSSSSSLPTTTSFTRTTSATATTTTTSTCAPSQTLSALPEQTVCPENTAADRSQWCNNLSVNDDILTTDYSTGQTKYFTFEITSTNINFDGTIRPSFAINGGTPGPAIEVNWGDLVEVTVINSLTDNATTIHWHGIRQFGTNDQDGVPGVTECAIPPGGSRTYTWLASSYGTGWYHSHALSQYGGGIRGPVIIHGPATAEYDYDMGHVMIDEIFSQTIFQMAWNIARLRGPLPAAVNYMVNGQNVSPDGSTGTATQWTVEPGKKHLFRIINSSAQSFFIVHFDYHEMTVISSDYTPIVPYTTTSLYVSPGQRYNVIVEMDQTPGAYFMRAITQTGCGEQNVNTGLGIANPVFTYRGSCGTPTSETLSITPASDCRDEPLASLVPVVPRDGGSIDDFTSTAQLLPGGNGGSQVFDGYGAIIRWYFGGMLDLNGNSASVLGNQTISVDFENPTLKTMAELPTLGFNSSKYSNAVVLDGPAGDWVYFVIQNNFQTSHPIHLHGHDFSVLGQGKGVFTADQASSLNFVNPARRDTALLYGFVGQGGVAESGWTVIGFQTNNPGAWIMHCHIIWHADGGMGLQYIEQPNSIDAEGYWGSDAFQNECTDYSAYQDGGGEGKLTYEAGIKRDLLKHKHALKAKHH